jgi:hypothetical protein
LTEHGLKSLRGVAQMFVPRLFLTLALFYSYTEAFVLPNNLQIPSLGRKLPSATCWNPTRADSRGFVAGSTGPRNGIRMSINNDDTTGEGAKKSSLENIGEFAITSMFKSSFYIGSEDLHLPVPIPSPDSYPEGFPPVLRLPSLIYKMADLGVDAGFIKKADPDDAFTIRFGLLRAIASRKQRTLNAFDASTSSKKMQEAASRLMNIGSDERYRRGKNFSLAVCLNFNKVSGGGKFCTYSTCERAWVGAHAPPILCVLRHIFGFGEDTDSYPHIHV